MNQTNAAGAPASAQAAYPMFSVDEDGVAVLYTEPDFRCYAPERLTQPDRFGNVWSQQCQEFLEGRWEGFAIFQKSRPAWNV